MSEEPLQERTVGTVGADQARTERPAPRRRHKPQPETTETPHPVPEVNGDGPAEAEPPSGEGVACAHLGLEHDPFKHYAQSSSEHRCYLWMQRDRIDRSHQEMFCLTEEHKSCPWLAVSTPKRPEPLHRRVADNLRMSSKIMGGIEELESPWQRNILLAVVTISAVTYRWSSAAWRASQPVLLRLAILALFGLRLLTPVLLWPMRWLSNRYLALQRKALHAPGHLTQSAASAMRRRDLTTGRETRPENLASPFVRLPSMPADAPTITYAQDAAEMAQVYLARGQEAMRSGDSAGALRRFRLATAANEQDEQAWLWRGALAPTVEEKTESFRRALAINPQSGRARAALVELGVSLEQEHLPADLVGESAALKEREAGSSARSQLDQPLPIGASLLEQGVAAMRSGDEETAYQYFAMATQSDPANEQAWYWQAKTAPTVEEVIRCLRQITVINPSNAKAHADLAWAQQRQLREQARALEPQQEATPTTPSAASVVVSRLRAGILQLASVFAFAGGLMLSLPYVVRLMELPSSPELNSFAALLPIFKLPAMPINVSFLPAFEFGSVAPLVLGILLLHAAFSLGDGGGQAMRAWSVVLGVVAIGVFALYVSNEQALQLGLTLSAATVAAALIGKEAQPDQSARAEGSLY